MQMTSSRPYLVRAIYQWIVDNDMTPHLLVNAESDQVIVPKKHVQDGKIILNLGQRAVQTLEIGNQTVNFSARFSGVPMNLVVPINAILAIYAKENGQGRIFSGDAGASTDDDNSPDDPTPDKPLPGRPNLTLVK